MLDYDYYFEIDQWTNSDDRPWLFFLVGPRLNRRTVCPMNEVLKSRKIHDHSRIFKKSTFFAFKILLDALISLKHGKHDILK